MYLKLIKIFGYFRGVLAALAFLGTVPQFVPYSVLDLVAGVHAVIVGWNSIAAEIGQFCSSLLNLPEIPPALINAGIIGLTIGPPWAFIILKSEWKEHQGFVQNAAFWTRAIVGCIQVFLFSVMVASFEPSLIFFLSLLPLLIVFMAVLKNIPSYRSGFITVVGFLVAVESIYLVSTENVQAMFDNFMCAYESVGAPRCKADQ